MDIAKSMYLWGSTVEPHECDYDDTRELGLKCVFCHQPVFLVKGKEYTNSKGTNVKVKSYFSHYKKSEDSELCEKRVEGAEGRALKEFALGAPRGQRLRLYEDYLKDMIDWALVYILVYSNKSPVHGNHLKDCKKLLKEMRRTVPNDEEVKEYIKEFFSLNLDAIKGHIHNQDFYEQQSQEDRIILSEILSLAANNRNIALHVYGVGVALKRYTQIYLPQAHEDLLMRVEEEQRINGLSEDKARLVVCITSGVYLISMIRWYNAVNEWSDRNWRRSQGIKARGFG